MSASDNVFFYAMWCGALFGMMSIFIIRGLERIAKALEKIAGKEP